MTTRHWRARFVATFVASAVAAGIAACGQPPTSTVAATPTAAPPSPPTASPAPTTDPTTVAVLNAYAAEQAAWHQALAIADPTYPALAQTMVDPLLTRARDLLTVSQGFGVVGRGADTPKDAPHVVSQTATTAVVEQCVYSTLIEVYAKNGQPVPNQPGGTQPADAGIQVILSLVSGRWVASADHKELGRCPAGY